MYGQALEAMLQAPHSLGTDGKSSGKALLENTMVYSKHLSGNSLPVKYHELCFPVLLLVFQILTGLERILGHRLVSNLISSVNSVSAKLARPVTQP